RCAGFLGRAALCALTLFAAVTMAGCKKTDAAASGGGGPGGAGDGAVPAASSGKPITVGFIYVGTKDDYGYNQAHADGAAAVKKISGVKVIENENVKENKDCQSAMEGMINLSGATLIFPTSFGYFNPHVLEISKKY